MNYDYRPRRAKRRSYPQFSDLRDLKYVKIKKFVDLEGYKCEKKAWMMLQKRI